MSGATKRLNPKLGATRPRHRRGDHKRGNDGTVGSIALPDEFGTAFIRPGRWTRRRSVRDTK